MLPGAFLNFRDIRGSWHYVESLAPHGNCCRSRSTLTTPGVTRPPAISAPTQRFGSPDDFRYFVDLLHRRGIGVISTGARPLSPERACAGAFSMGRRCTSTRTRAGRARCGHGAPDFQLRPQRVKTSCWPAPLLAAGVSLDGLRVDAIPVSMYLDYSRRRAGRPSRHGGRENLEAIDFLRELTWCWVPPGFLTIAEESTAWPGPAWVGGLFFMKWNMG